MANGHPLLAAVTGTGCISSALTGCFLAAKPDEPLEAAAEALAALGVAAEDAAAGAAGPGTFHARLYDALAALDPETLDGRAQHRRVVTTLGELGEFGLLAELERRGLVAGNRARRGGRRRARRDAGRARRGRPLPLRPPRLARARRRGPPPSTSATSPPREPIRSRSSSRSGSHRETELDDVLELYAGLNERGVPVRGGDTTRADRVVMSVTALGRSERVPGRAGARPGDARRRHRAARRRGRRVSRDGSLPPCRIRVDGGQAPRAAWRPRCSTSRTGSRRRRAHRASAPAAASRSSSSAFRSPTARTLDDVGFGEDYELLATTPDPLGFPVIGRVEEGEGVELTLGGEPYSLAGWEHFR